MRSLRSVAPAHLRRDMPRTKTLGWHSQMNGKCWRNRGQTGLQLAMHLTDGDDQVGPF